MVRHAYRRVRVKDSAMPLNFEKLSVLVVEDTVPMLRLMNGVLATLGVRHLLAATNGQTGFDLFRKESPDVVIADWHMTPVDGIELTRMIRRDPLSPNRLAPVILVTGFSAVNRIGMARDVGVTEFLVKPFSANDLAKRLTHVINRPRDFIDASEYFGPDRRRRKNPDYSGPFRRDEDGAEGNETGDGKKARRIRQAPAS